MIPWLARAPRIADRDAGHDNNFNLIRMLAALGVMVSHAVPLTLGIGTPEPLEEALKGVNLGRVCVMVFFAISGFFITRSFTTKRDPVAFLRARALRIYPGLVVMLVLMLGIGGLWVATDPARFWRSAPDYVIRTLTFVVSARWLDGILETAPFPRELNGSLWSLRFEVACYIGVLLAGLSGLLDRRRAFLGCAAAFLAVYLVAPFVTTNFVIRRMLLVGLPFVIGAAFHLWRERIPLSPVLLAGLVAGAVLLRPTPLFPAAFVLALCHATFCLGFARIPVLARYNALGDYSYGTYIYAFPIQQMAVIWGFGTPLTNLAVAVPLTLGCAILSWRLVEAPAMRFGRSRRFVTRALDK